MFKLLKKREQPQVSASSESVVPRTGTPDVSEIGDVVECETSEENPSESPGAKDPVTEEESSLPASDGEETMEKEVGPDDETALPEEDAEALSAAFEAWLDENISGSEDRESAIATMADVIESLSEGGDKTALFDVVARGADYARAIEAASVEGEVRGRNANIREQMELELDGDGVPHPGVGGSVYNAPMPSIFELARGASM